MQTREALNEQNLVIEEFGFSLGVNSIKWTDVKDLVQSRSYPSIVQLILQLAYAQQQWDNRRATPTSEINLKDLSKNDAVILVTRMLDLKRQNGLAVSLQRGYVDCSLNKRSPMRKYFLIANCNVDLAQFLSVLDKISFQHTLRLCETYPHLIPNFISVPRAADVEQELIRPFRML